MFIKLPSPAGVMKQEALAEVLSSMVRLRIEDALSVRPRTLNELSALTGISVQGVLRHLRRLEEIGLVEERRLAPSTPKARAVYAAKSELVGDYSIPGLTVVKATVRGTPPPRRGRPDLERLSADVLIGRRRVKDQARRLGRAIEGLAMDQAALSAALDGAAFSESERLLLRVLLTEETTDDGVEALSRFYGIDDRRSIEAALAKAKRDVRR